MNKTLIELISLIKRTMFAIIYTLTLCRVYILTFTFLLTQKYYQVKIARKIKMLLSFFPNTHQLQKIKVTQFSGVNNVFFSFI